MKNKPYPWNNIPPIKNLKHLIEKHAKESPDDIAFVQINRKGKMHEISYSELYNDMLRFGTWMFYKGYHKSRIAIIGENSYEWILSFFAVVNGGNIAVPIDKSLDKNSILEQITHSKCTTVIVSDNYADIFENGCGIKCILMSSINECINKGMEVIISGYKEYIDFPINIDDVAIISYTSGTTGKSRGVILSQKNIVSDINNGCQNFNPNGNVLIVLPLHHMFGLVVGMLMVLNYKCSIYINTSLKYLKRDLNISKPQTLFLVPMFVETLSKNIWDNACITKQDKRLKFAMKLSDLILKAKIDLRKKFFISIHNVFGGNLEYILCGGAPLNPKYITEFRTWGIEILNAYGATECSPGIAVNRNYHHKDGSVGLPIPNCVVKISESNEILVQGDNVMLGYYNDEQSTAEALVDGWYHTGDLGYIDTEGFLFLTGRKKNLIILSNGENVSPEEIEARILNDDAVSEVVVYDDGGQIVAEIYPADGFLDDKPHFDSLIRQINDAQPKYKQVSVVKLRKSEFQKNATKKIIRYKVKEEQNNV